MASLRCWLANGSMKEYENCVKRVMQTTQTFTYILFNLLMETGSAAEKLASVKRLYEVGNIPNRVGDGQEPFPENQQSLEMGISIEFRSCILIGASFSTHSSSRNVSFKYPGSDSFALHNISFRIEKGQLCVRVPV